MQGLPFEVHVIACYNLKDKEWISRQDPYVTLEYGSTKYRTKTCTDGGKNPMFREKFIFTTIDGLKELKVVVWNSHTLTSDELIGSGRIQLQKALSRGYDDVATTLYTKSGRKAGEIQVILQFSDAKQSKTKLDPFRSQYPAPSTSLPQVQPYSVLPSAPTAPPAPYPAMLPYAASTSCMGYSNNSATYHPSPYSPIPPPGYHHQACTPTGYPSHPYPPNHQASAYYQSGPSGMYQTPPPPSGIYQTPQPSGMYPAPASSGMYAPPPSSGMYPPPPR